MKKATPPKKRPVGRPRKVRPEEGKQELVKGLAQLEKEKEQFEGVKARLKEENEQLKHDWNKLEKSQQTLLLDYFKDLSDNQDDFPQLPFHEKIDEFGNYHSEEELEKPFQLGPTLSQKQLRGLWKKVSHLSEAAQERAIAKLKEKLPPAPQKFVLDGASHELVPCEEAYSQGLYKQLGIYGNTDTPAKDIAKTLQGFRYGISSGMSEFEWSWSKQETMFRRSQEEGQKGIGAAIKRLTTKFVVGTGPQLRYDDPEASDEKNKKLSQLLQKFWNDNGMDDKVEPLSNQIVNRGEIFCKANKDTENNRYWCDFIDPIEIQDFLYSIPYGKVLKWYRWAGWSSGVEKRELEAEGGHDEELKQDYDFYHWAFNKPLKVVRGRSDLYAVLYWLRLYGEFLKIRFFLNRFRSVVAWHKIIEGGPGAVAGAKTWVEKPWPIGAVLVTSNKVHYEALKSNIDAGKVKEDADQFREIIAGPSGFPIHWLFQTAEAGSRSQAETMGRVPRRLLKSRQGVVSRVLVKILFGALKFYVGPTKRDENNELKNMSLAGYFHDSEGYCVQIENVKVDFPELDLETAKDVQARASAVRSFKDAEVGSDEELHVLAGFRDYRRSKAQKKKERKEAEENEIQDIYDDLGDEDEIGDPNDPSSAETEEPELPVEDKSSINKDKDKDLNKDKPNEKDLNKDKDKPKNKDKKPVLDGKSNE